MPCVSNIRPLISPAEGDGDLGPGAIAGVGDDVFRVDGEHPAGGELPISSALGGGEAPKDGGDHFVVILEGVVVAPRWSVASDSVVVVVVWLFSLELLSQAEAVLDLVLAVLVERAWALEDLLALLIVVALGTRFINGGGDIDQIWTLSADHGRCPNGGRSRRSGDHCGIGRRGARRCGELGGECSHPR